MEPTNNKDLFLTRMSDNMQHKIHRISVKTQEAKQDLTDLSCVSACLEQIEKTGSELSAMIQGLVDIISIKNGMLQLANEEFSLYSLAERIQDTVIQDAKRKNIDFKLDLSDLHHDELIGDEAKLMQIMINLLSNALKFTPKNGTISVTVEENASSKMDSTHFKVTVRDSGIGIDEERLVHLFDPFFESVPTTRGLGLIVTKYLVELMNGTISVESCPGKGSAFSVELDLQTQTLSPYATLEKSETKTTGFSGMRFMIVDDSEVSRAVSSNLLEGTGAITEHVNNGKEALDRFVANPVGYYDLILMDIHMPIMGGLEASTAIRTSGKEDAKRIPIIAMTTNPFENGINNSLESGINAHLSKPLTMVDVLMTIGKFL